MVGLACEGGLVVSEWCEYNKAVHVKAEERVPGLRENWILWGIAKDPPRDARWALVERIAASVTFRKAPQQRDILLYVAARSLTEDPAVITEQQIGSTVLGRGPDFDPGHDNIVRAQMRHLRTKLGEYFSGEGGEEDLVLAIPKGHYVAEFGPRQPAVEAVLVEAENNGKPNQLEFPAEPRRSTRKWRIGFALLLGAVIILITWLRPQTGAGPGVPDEYGLYANVLGTGNEDPFQIVLGNPVVLLYAGSPSKGGQEIGAADGIPVPPELAERFDRAANRADKVMPYHLLQIKTHDYTGLGDALACHRLGGLMQVLGRRSEVTQSRFLNWESARRQDLIIVGSPHTNEWAERNVPRHCFTIVKMGVQNGQPRDGEPELYPITYDASGYPVTDYGLIWSWKTASGSRVLVLAGPSSAATGAMAALFCDPEQFRPVYERVQASAGGRTFPTDWQVLLRVDVRDNLPVRTTYVTHRVYSPE